MNYTRLIVLLLLFSGFLFASEANNNKKEMPAIVPVSWLKKNIDNPKVVIIDLQPKDKYLKDFSKLNFRVDKQFILKYWSYTIYFDIQNITNNLNEEGKAYNHDYTEYLIVQGIPFFPSLGIKGEF